MMATALENNGATVYIIGRRKEVLESAAAKNSVRPLHLLPNSFSSESTFQKHRNLRLNKHNYEI